jgi:hypothetical protein
MFGRVGMRSCFFHFVVNYLRLGRTGGTGEITDELVGGAFDVQDER